MVNCPQDWFWSSFRAIVGLAESPAWLHHDWLLSAFGKRKADAIDHYLKFVSDGLQQTSIWSDLKQPIYLGGDQLLKDVIPIRRTAAKAGISHCRTGSIAD